MIRLYTGLTGSGKSLALAEDVIRIAYRNARIYRKTGTLRRIFSNLLFVEEFTQQFPPGMFVYFKDPFTLPEIAHGCDIIFDEISLYLDSTQWALCPPEFKQFLRQHRKRGNIDIYGTAQDFDTVDVTLRRLVHKLTHAQKLIGSPNPSIEQPVIKTIWGICWYRDVKRESFKKGGNNYEYEGLFGIFGEFRWISREACSIYDTTQEMVDVEYPPLRHIHRKCDTCEFETTSHK